MSTITPAMILEELLRFREAPPSDTVSFNWSHQRLCETCQEKLELLGDSFLKYHHISYLVQGPRDQGVDVLFKTTDDEGEGEECFTGIQIKSYAELDDKNNDLSKNLKAGYHDTRAHYGTALERYYITLCGDAIKHSKRISAITNEFSKEPKVRVIAPRHLYTFMTMPESTILAIVDSMLRKDDFVRSKAKREMRGYNDAEIYFLLSCLSFAFESGSDQLPEEYFESVFDSGEMEDRFGHEAFENAFWKFQDSFLEIFAMEGTTRVRVESFPATRALYFDLEVRYGEHAEDRFNHLFEFLRI